PPPATMALTRSRASGMLPSGSWTSRLAVSPPANAHRMPGPKPSRAVTRTTDTRMRVGRTSAISITGARPAWTIPTTMARRTLVYVISDSPGRRAAYGPKYTGRWVTTHPGDGAASTSDVDLSPSFHVKP